MTSPTPAPVSKNLLLRSLKMATAYAHSLALVRLHLTEKQLSVFFVHTVKATVTSLNRKGNEFKDVRKTTESLGGPANQSWGYLTLMPLRFSAKTSVI